jgi:hypothetical protein
MLFEAQKELISKNEQIKMILREFCRNITQTMKHVPEISCNLSYLNDCNNILYDPLATETLMLEFFL